MKNYTFLFLFGALIMQSEPAYSCETAEKQNCVLDLEGLKVVQQLKGFQRYSYQRQEEMRDEAEMLRPSFDECRSFISAKIRCLENERRDIVIVDGLKRYRQVHKAHYQAYRNLKVLKVQEFFNRFASTGEIDLPSLFQLAESCVLVGEVLKENLKHPWAICAGDMEKALTVSNKMVRLNFLMLGLEDYALFNVFSPVSQLRTQFVIMNSLLETVVTSIPCEVLLEAEISLFEAELREANATREALKVEAQSYQDTINDTSDTLKQLFLAGDSIQAQVVTRTKQKTVKKLNAALSQQQDLARKEGDLVTHLAALHINGKRVGANSCFESLLREIKGCAELLQLYASDTEVQKLPYKFNTLSLQDQEFVTNVLALRNRISFQAS